MINICFLIRQLNVGGAQRQLIELAKRLDKSVYSVTVLTFYGGGQLCSEMESVPGVRLINLSKRGRWDLIPFFFRLVSQVRAANPDILHSYLGVSNLLAVLLKPFLAGPRIVWGVRASYKNLREYDWLTRVTFWIERLLSRFPDLIIANSMAGRDYYAGEGFPAAKMVVVPNGIDSERFSPDTDARNRLRRNWGIPDDGKLIGLVGRLDPRKGHETFLLAASSLASRREDVTFVCVGDGPAALRMELHALGESLGLGTRLRWPGALSDMVAVYNALDILTSASYFGEGFSNVVGEAMSCGVACVVSDVGDSRWIVGDAGIVVTPGDPGTLTSAWEQLLGSADERIRLGKQGRDRIVSEFAPEILAERTAAALTKLL